MSYIYIIQIYPVIKFNTNNNNKQSISKSVLWFSSRTTQFFKIKYFSFRIKYSQVETI